MRSTERIIDIGIVALDQLLNKGSVVGRFSGIETQVVE